MDRQSRLSNFIQNGGTGVSAPSSSQTAHEVPVTRAQSPSRSPRIHPYGTAPAQAGGPAGLSTLSMSGPAPSPVEAIGSGSASESVVPASLPLNHIPTSGIPANLLRPLHDPVNNVKAPGASSLIQNLIAQM